MKKPTLNPKSKAFDWLHALEWLASSGAGVTQVQAIKLRHAAANWPTCACGQVCKGLPKLTSGGPMDTELYYEGRSFSISVLNENWPNALATFHRIEARTAKLLAKQKRKDTSCAGN